MEDSEKRKQMLKAMRMEAAAAAQNDGSTGTEEASMNTGHLSNPLAEASTQQQESYDKSRFDYYTDPMAAYSSFKRSKSPKQQYTSSPSHQMSPPVPQFPPSVPGSVGNDHQGHLNHGGFQEARYGGDNLHSEPRGMAPETHYGGNNMHTEPRGMAPSYRGPPAAWNNNFRPPPVNHLGQPQWVPRPYPFPQGNHDMGNNRYGGRGPRGGNYDNTPQQFSHYGRQNPNWAGNTYPNSGRGRGRGRGMNTGFGRGGGRRPMEQGAQQFYSNSMAEDPWKYLKPVLWKSCSDASSSNSTGQAWRPNSIAPKHPMISETSLKPSDNQQSLAEYLAASLDEATCDEPSN